MAAAGVALGWHSVDPWDLGSETKIFNLALSRRMMVGLPWWWLWIVVVVILAGYGGQDLLATRRSCLSEYHRRPDSIICQTG